MKVCGLNLLADVYRWLHRIHRRRQKNDTPPDIIEKVENYAHIPTGAKWILSFFMLMGRLELFTILMLFSPSFWKK